MTKGIRTALLALALAIAAPAFADRAVDINRADASELAAALVGVGMKKAEAIVAHREQHGPFKSADELVKVKGIGLATVERNRDRILVGPAPERTEPAP
ncbi:MAG: ComEA family DNA-binding protein [Xanthomonadales bacterium]|nr:ComEA family DNA-binding protein [Xanthomonadales bacterium]